MTTNSTQTKVKKNPVGGKINEGVLRLRQSDDILFSKQSKLAKKPSFNKGKINSKLTVSSKGSKKNFKKSAKAELVIFQKGSNSTDQLLRHFSKLKK
jgi:hypothetical protein